MWMSAHGLAIQALQSNVLATFRFQRGGIRQQSE